MKYLKQSLIILAFCLIGEVLSWVIPLPIPAVIYGFVALFLGLCTGLVKPEHIKECANWLISVMGLFLVAPCVNVLAYYDIIAPALVPICITVISSTLLVFAVAGLVTQGLLKKGGKENG